MDKKTGELVEVTKSWLGVVIWLKDYDLMNPYIPPEPFTYICDDDRRFNRYIDLGEL
jgi:hypothetical protein